jgi:hypothetical protein
MKRTLAFCALLVLAATTAACSFSIFEDIGSDPHPPTLEITELVLYVEPPPPPEPVAGRVASPPHGWSSTWDSGGFTLGAGKKFQIGVAYTDAGGDIVKLHLRDRDGALDVDLIPTDLAYFPGTSGTSIGPALGIELVGVAGRHRLELWAEDSHKSRSEKVEFVITRAL